MRDIFSDTDNPRISIPSIEDSCAIIGVDPTISDLLESSSARDA